jgi:hypothetical protein
VIDYGGLAMLLASYDGAGNDDDDDDDDGVKVLLGAGAQTAREWGRVCGSKFVTLFHDSSFGALHAKQKKFCRK